MKKRYKLTRKEILAALLIGGFCGLLTIVSLNLIPDPNYKPFQGRVATPEEKRMMRKLTDRAIEARIVDKMIEKERMRKEAAGR